jgi:hypothetical protein
MYKNDIKKNFFKNQYVYPDEKKARHFPKNPYFKPNYCGESFADAYFILWTSSLLIPKFP